jgi:hypothetical protein
MNVRTRQRRIAQAVWAAGGRLEEVAERERVHLRTLRRWLAEPEFQAMLAEEAIEPILQASSAVMRWAPAAVARLIRDLDSKSATSARHAAREILRLALDAQEKLGRGGVLAPAGVAALADSRRSLADDPLTRSVAALTDDEVERIFGMLTNEGEEGSAGEARPTGSRRRREGGGR